MKPLAYALAIAILLAVPAAGAEPVGDAPADAEADASDCNWFYYTIDPPGARLDPDCLLDEIP